MADKNFEVLENNKIAWKVINIFALLLLWDLTPRRSKYRITRHYSICILFNCANIFKERRMCRNKLSTVTGYSLVKHKLKMVDWILHLRLHLVLNYWFLKPLYMYGRVYDKLIKYKRNNLWLFIFSVYAVIKKFYLFVASAVLHHLPYLKRATSIFLKIFLNK